MKCGLVVEGCCYDNSTNVELIDGCLHADAAALAKAEELQIPFYKDIEGASSRAFQYIPLRICTYSGEPCSPWRDVSHTHKSGARQEIAPSHTIKLGDFYVDSTAKFVSGISPQAAIMKDGQSERLALELQHPEVFSTMLPDMYGSFVLMFLELAMQHGHYDNQLSPEHTVVISLFSYIAFDMFRAIAYEWQPDLARGYSPNFLDPMSAKIFLKTAAAPAFHMLARPSTWPPWNRRAVQERWLETYFHTIKKQVPSGVVTVADFERLSQIENAKVSQASKTWAQQVRQPDAPPALSDIEARRCEQSALNAACALVVKCQPQSCLGKFSMQHKSLKQQYIKWSEAIHALQGVVKPFEEPAAEPIGSDTEDDDAAVEVKGPHALVVKASEVAAAEIDDSDADTVEDLPLCMDEACGVCGWRHGGWGLNIPGGCALPGGMV